VKKRELLERQARDIEIRIFNESQDLQLLRTVFVKFIQIICNELYLG